MTFTFNVNAGLYVEPYYLKSSPELGQSKEKKNPTGINDEYDFDGQVYGTRLGWAWAQKHIVGIDVSQSQSTWKLKAPEAVKNALTTLGSSHSDKWDGLHLGIFAGHRDENWIITVSALYTVFEDTNDNSLIPKGDKLDGYSFNVGVGYAIAGIFKFSVEWRGATLRRYTDKSNNVSYTLPSEKYGVGEYRTQEYYIAVSLPITLGQK